MYVCETGSVGIRTLFGAISEDSVQSGLKWGLVSVSSGRDKDSRISWCVQPGLGTIGVGMRAVLRVRCMHISWYTSHRAWARMIVLLIMSPLLLSVFLSFHSIVLFIDLCRLLSLFHCYYMSCMYSIPRTSVYMWHERNKVHVQFFWDNLWFISQGLMTPSW